MRRVIAGVLLVLVGLGLMLNPVYLPVALAEPDVVYTHTVYETDGGTPDVDADAVVAYEDLPADAQQVFETARERDAGVQFQDPDERVDAFAYPSDPEPGNGMLVVETDDSTYELWTRSVTQEGTFVLAQRIALQPVLFLLGFFSVVAGLVLLGATAGWWDGPESP